MLAYIDICMRIQNDIGGTINLSLVYALLFHECQSQGQILLKLNPHGVQELQVSKNGSVVD